MKKYQVRGVAVRIKNLGDHFVEVIASTCKKELQFELLSAANSVDYTADCQRIGNGNLKFRLLPTDGTDFERLRERFAYLFADTVNTFNERNAADQSGSPTRDDRAASAHPRPALAT